MSHQTKEIYFLDINFMISFIFSHFELKVFGTYFFTFDIWSIGHYFIVANTHTLNLSNSGTKTQKITKLWFQMITFHSQSYITHRWVAFRASIVGNLGTELTKVFLLPGLWHGLGVGLRLILRHLVAAHKILLYLFLNLARNCETLFSQHLQEINLISNFQAGDEAGMKVIICAQK